jgi:hypothetical protein
VGLPNDSGEIDEPIKDPDEGHSRGCLKWEGATEAAGSRGLMRGLPISVLFCGPSPHGE